MPIASLLSLAAATTLLIMPVVAVAAEEDEAAWPIALPGCPDKCGNISIPYPFGTKEGCYFGAGFYIHCNLSYTPPSATVGGVIMKNGSGYYLENQGGDLPGIRTDDGRRFTWILDLVDIDVAEGVARVNGPVSYDCNVNETYHSISVFVVSVKLSPAFLLSTTRNALVGVGQSVEARLSGQIGSTAANYSATCKSLIDAPSVAQNGTCLGLGCCSAEMPPGTDMFTVSMEHQNNTGWKTTPCRYAMVVDKSWYSFSAGDLYGHDLFDRTTASDGVPLVLDFAIWNESCPLAGGRLPAACRSGNSVCVNATHGIGYLCKCKDGYEGNPYLPDGCRGTQTCDNPHYVYYIQARSQISSLLRLNSSLNQREVTTLAECL